MDKRPKRRKYKDNPYILNSIEKENKYTVTFKDSTGIVKIVDINVGVFGEFNKFELDDKSELNEFDNHIEHFEMFEELLNNKISEKPISLEELVENKITCENLHIAIEKLPIIQKRRLKMYYFEDMTLKEIAEIEKCALMSIKDSLDVSIKNLKKFLN